MEILVNLIDTQGQNGRGVNCAETLQFPFILEAVGVESLVGVLRNCPSF